MRFKYSIIFLLLLSSFIYSQTGISLTFSEVMFNPSESNGEFVEIYNTSSTTSVDLTGFKVKYYTSASDVIISFRGGTVLGPGEYAVVIENDYNFTGSVYESLIPAGVIVLKTTDAAFGSSGMANTTSREVYLYNSTNDLLDTYTYSANNNGGYSDEKEFITKDNSPFNWSNTLNENGTPGQINSITPRLYNLSFESITFSPQFPEEGESVEINFIIKNVGLATAQNYTVKLYNDVNSNDTAETWEEIFSGDYVSLAYNNTQTGTHNFLPANLGTYSIIGVVIFVSDEIDDNNSIVSQFEVYPRSGSYNDIVINEIMYAPNSPEPEWIELYNRSSEIINLKDWEIGDNTSTVKISNTDFFLDPDEFIVLSDNQIIDSLYEIASQLVVLGLPSYNNAGDDVILKSYTDRTIDSVKYNPNWGGNTGGKSLERKDIDGSSLDSTNWASANLPSGGTPGEINSVVPVQYDLNLLSVEITPVNPIVGDTLQIKATVENVGTEDIGNYSISFYEDADGDSIAEVEELFSETNSIGLPSASTTEITAEYITTETGVHNFIVALTSAEDTNDENNRGEADIEVNPIPTEKYDVVINEIMYSPTDDEPEWVEIYNRSTNAINLKNWFLGDNSSSITITTTDYVISPQEYVVITRDSIITSYYTNNIKFIERAIPTLNNSGDDVRIIDNNGRMIDSTKYESTWGGNSGGKSLERRDVDASSTLSTNWGTSISISKATPSLENSITKKNNDVAIISFTSSQNNVEVGQNILLRVEIKNQGKLNADNISIKLYHDYNFDQLTELDELVETVIYSLNADSSCVIEFNYSNIIAGINQFIAVINFPIDQIIENNISLISLTGYEIGEERGDLVINEIMYAPNSPEPEWIEIYNNTSETIDLKGYQISDNTTKTEIFNFSFIISANDFLVIAKDSSILLKHPELQKVFIHEFATLNNTTDDVVLYDSLDRVIDSVSYSSTWGGSNGKSLERIIITGNSADSANWKSSTTLIGSTPGLTNSVVPVQYDLRLMSVEITPLNPIVGDTLQIKAAVENIGTDDIGNYTVSFYEDKDGDTIADAEELFSETNSIGLPSASTTEIKAEYITTKTGEHNFIVVLTSAEDTNDDNNKLETNVEVDPIPAEKYNIVINEIMYAPLNDEPEWIEIYNRSGETINLKDWKIGDNSSMISISSFDFQLENEEILVISRDSSIKNYYTNGFNFIVKSLPTFSNAGDDVIIRDGTNKTIDSLKYSSSWGGNSGGKSLERKDYSGDSNDPSNWETSISANRATPGLANSVIPINYDLTIKSFSYSDNFVLVGDTLVFTTDVQNIGISSAQSFFIKFFYDSNFNNIPDSSELLSRKLINELDPDSIITEQFSFDQLNQGNNHFILEVEFNLDENPSNNISVIDVYATLINEIPGDIVINEIMYAPISPEPEWIEVINRSQKIINLKGYKIKDDASSITVFINDKILYPNDYFVIARDSNFFNVHPEVQNVSISRFPSLLNTSDKIILCDSLNRTIDSVYYESTWGGNGGRSLERRDPLSPSGNSEVWWSSVNIGGTPGKLNSIALKDHDLKLSVPNISPHSPMVGEEVKISVGIRNAGRNDATFNLLLYEVIDDQKNFIKGITLTLPPMEDVIYVPGEMSHTINSLLTTRTFEYYIEYPEDQDTSNNRTTIVVRPGYNSGTVKINEIMFNPVNGEPEWFELYNDSDYIIDVEKWSVSDILTTPQKVELESALIHPHSLLVVTKDSSIINFHSSVPSAILVSTFANLNNDEDGIILKDPYGTVIDSVHYKSDWGGANGKSIERININGSSNDEANWNSSNDIELSTPGRINSTTPKKYDVTVGEIFINPQNPVSGEFVIVSSKLFNFGTSAAVNITLQFFIITESDTSLISTINNLSIPSGDSLLIESGNVIQIIDELHILCKVIFTEDEVLTNNIANKIFGVGHQRNSILITEIMYNPLDNEPEWIEFVNNSASIINLKNWSINDQYPAVNKISISNEDYLLPPNQFALITPDTNKYLYDTPDRLLQVNFGSLGNTSDGIILYDNYENIIDSLEYDSKWGGSKGVSLERLSLSSPSNDSSNWASSLNQFGASPGLSNSYNNIPGYQYGDLIINEIMFDPATGNSEFIEFYNTSDDTLQIGGMKLNLSNEKKINISPTHYNLLPNSFFVLAHDSSIFNNYNWLVTENVPILFNSSLSLTNESSLLLLKDTKNNTLDSLIYNSDWHNRNVTSTKNRSLERINPEINGTDFGNWNTSVDPNGASPGKINSIYTENPFRSSTVSISPNPFSPDNDGFEDFAIINFNLLQKIAQTRIKVFDSIGRLVRTISNNRPSGSNNSIIFDGLDDSGRPLRIGIYILLIEISTDSGFVETIKTPIVVARKL